MSLQNLKALVTISLWTGHWNGTHVNRIHTQGNLGTFHTRNEENHDICILWKMYLGSKTTPANIIASTVLKILLDCKLGKKHPRVQDYQPAC